VLGVRLWARYQARSFWGLWARWRVRLLDIRQGPRSRIPGELGIRRRDLAAGAQNKPGLEPKQLHLKHLELKKLEPRGKEFKHQEIKRLQRRSKRPPK
jgi:hypothetical protein